MWWQIKHKSALFRIFCFHYSTVGKFVSFCSVELLTFTDSVSSDAGVWGAFFLLKLKRPFNLAKRPLVVAGSSRTNRRVVRLCTEPNATATTVHARQMTLYGMLKSGVGRETSKDSVCSRKKNWVELSFNLWRSSKTDFIYNPKPLNSWKFCVYEITIFIAFAFWHINLKHEHLLIIN